MEAEKGKESGYYHTPSAGIQVAVTKSGLNKGKRYKYIWDRRERKQKFLEWVDTPNNRDEILVEIRDLLLANNEMLKKIVNK